jgi:hypothetical protein
MGVNVHSSGLGAKRLKILAVAAALVFVYIPSRLFVLNSVKEAGTDTELYARYAYIHRLASERHVSFYELYRDRGLADIARGRHDMLFDPLAMTVVAYPPFAVAVMTMPALFIKNGQSDEQSFTEQYKKNFRIVCAAAESAGVVIACLLILMLYGGDTTLWLIFRMSLLILGGLCMPRILYDRLDVFLGALLVLSLALLARRAVFLSFFVFALAVSFKLVPVFLLPVWVLGSVRTSGFVAAPLRARIISIALTAVTRCAELCLITAGVALVFYMIEGKGVFDFLKFHLDRGVHIESIWGSFSLLAARLSDASFRLAWSYGAYNVITTATPVLAALSLQVVAVLLTGATVALAVRRVLQPGGTVQAPAFGIIIEAALLFLCIVFSFSRIFSPQYLLAIVPLVALLPCKGRGAFAVTCLFLGTCFMSTLIYPYFYTRAILHGPSWFGIFLLTSRMALLAGMTGVLFVRQFGPKESG